MRVFGVPIEPLDERYSIQWKEWFDPDTHRWVDGSPLTDRIETGHFLDVHGTHFYKASQIQALARMLHDREIHDGDWVFFHDLWFPGLEALAYIRSAVGPKFRIAGCLHAGTWDPWDFLSLRGMQTWSRGFERTLFDIADLIFVATDYHRMLIQKTFGDLVTRRIRVTGFPIYPQSQLEVPKEKGLVVFPHRLDPEKQPDHFNTMAKIFEGRGYRFVMTKDVCQTKSDYYNLLARAEFAVSFAQQETWGIAMQEALFAGAVPVVPDRLSYQEMYPMAFRFRGLFPECRRAFELIESLVANPVATEALRRKTRDRLVDVGAKAIGRMMSEMDHYGH